MSQATCMQSFCTRYQVLFYFLQMKPVLNFVQVLNIMTIVAVNKIEPKSFKFDAPYKLNIIDILFLTHAKVWTEHSLWYIII